MRLRLGRRRRIAHLTDCSQLKSECLLQHSLPTLNHGDRRGSELHIRQAGGPIRIGTASFGSSGRRGRLGGHTGRQVSVLNLGRRNGGLATWFDRRLVLAGRGVPALVGAERRGTARRRNGDGDVTVAETGQAHTGLKCGPLIGKGRRTLLEMDVGCVDERDCNGSDKQSP